MKLVEVRQNSIIWHLNLLINIVDEVTPNVADRIAEQIGKVVERKIRPASELSYEDLSPFVNPGEFYAWYRLDFPTKQSANNAFKILRRLSRGKPHFEHVVSSVFY